MTEELANGNPTYLSYIMYKLDRTLAVAGVIAITITAIIFRLPDAVSITTAAIGGLVGYVGGRSK